VKTKAIRLAINIRRKNLDLKFIHSFVEQRVNSLDPSVWLSIEDVCDRMSLGTQIRYEEFMKKLYLAANFFSLGGKAA
jgi:hypothetical protein